MRYSTVPAINLEAHVARNRELIQALPPRKISGDQCVWSEGRWISNPELSRYN